MPKASFKTLFSRNSTNANVALQIPTPLKRNQACHQCRRRKLKWYVLDETALRLSFVELKLRSDANRPCSTCVRSHAYMLSHNTTGGIVPDHPDCTYDEAQEESEAPSTKSQDRHRYLESRIEELEALLRSKDAQPEQTTTYFSASPRAMPPRLFTGDQGLQTGSLSSPGANLSSPSDGGTTLVSAAALSYDDFDMLLAPHANFAMDDFPGEPLFSPGEGGDVAWSSWPKDLPRFELLKHLVELFITFHPHANRMFDTPNLLVSVSFPPNHPSFPAACVLHAICAISTFYTPTVSSPPLPDLTKSCPDQMFTENERIAENRADSFAEEQAKLAKASLEHLEVLGENLFAVLQARILLSWFYWSHARWVEVFLASGSAMRLMVPLGLNMCPPFHSLTTSPRGNTLLEPAKSAYEDEIRRNTFWIAYAIERQHGLGNGWAHTLTDEDISQLLPTRADRISHGVDLVSGDRQWAHHKDVLFDHPYKNTDSFTLYVKGTILVSKVKSFNLRFRTKHQAFCHDSQAINLKALSYQVDPRKYSAFLDIEHDVSTFGASFPQSLRDPFANGIVDPHLFAACLMPHTSALILHEPHANLRIDTCPSARAILESSREILDLVYKIWATSFDIALLDPFCVYSWFTAGQILSRFLQAAIVVDNAQEIQSLRSEIGFIMLAIGRFGERLPLAYKYHKKLQDHMQRYCKPVQVVAGAVVPQDLIAFAGSLQKVV